MAAKAGGNRRVRAQGAGRRDDGQRGLFKSENREVEYVAEDALLLLEGEQTDVDSLRNKLGALLCKGKSVTAYCSSEKLECLLEVMMSLNGPVMREPIVPIKDP